MTAHTHTIAEKFPGGPQTVEESEIRYCIQAEASLVRLRLLRRLTTR